MAPSVSCSLHPPPETRTCTLSITCDFTLKRFKRRHSGGVRGILTFPRDVLCKVYDLPPEDPKIRKEESEVLEALKIEREHGEYRWSQLLKRDEVQTGRRVLLAYGMQFMNQMGGINLVVYYITSVLQTNVGLDRNLSLLLGGVINLMFPIGSLFPTFFLDKYGRRKPMMIGSFFLGVCMMMISILLSFQDRGGQLAKSTSSASVAFFFLYMVRSCPILPSS